MQRTEEQKKEFRKKLSEAPEQLTEYLGSKELSGAIRSIGERNGLHIDALGAFAYLIGDALVGVFSPTDLQERLQQELDLDEQKSSKMLGEIEKEIFTKARALVGEQKKEGEDGQNTGEAKLQQAEDGGESSKSTPPENTEKVGDDAPPKESQESKETQEKEGQEKPHYQVDPYREPID